MPAKKQPKISAEEKSLNRDYVIARAGIALAELRAAQDSIMGMLLLFAAPDEDPKNKEREHLYDQALEHASCAVRALESVEQMNDYDPEESEPWDDEEEDEEEEEDDEDDDESEGDEE